MTSVAEVVDVLAGRAAPPTSQRMVLKHSEVDVAALAMLGYSSYSGCLRLEGDPSHRFSLSSLSRVQQSGPASTLLAASAVLFVIEHGSTSCARAWQCFEWHLLGSNLPLHPVLQGALWVMPTPGLWQTALHQTLPLLGWNCQVIVQKA